jgi:membrane-bound serine protease (ClpP class)
MLLFFLELQAPGIGIFGVAGVISFFLGAFLLFGGFSTPPIPTPSFRISLWLISTVTALLAAILIFFLRTIIVSRHAVPISTTKPLIGSVGVVSSDLAPKGMVQMESEVWSAVPEKEDETIKAGTRVKVVSLEGLTLKVTKANE